ncbi:related to nicotinamide mononucleotide permease [Sporisorium reilianum SRZ2]|uniref:Related to nicotinamide mononucleotide permease n=1 Tax=Sporisorium reilianum (strain SRZ2) TaxID=999809 RepID=E6ZJK4_SPORE|nr:related to nicotinamide mononucleotide permease [Sporisorium reilianum SRZ2]
MGYDFKDKDDPDGGADHIGPTTQGADSPTSSTDSHTAAQKDAYLSKLTKWWSDDEEAAIRRKLDLRIVTTSFFLYLCATLDRANIGNAKTAGMEASLHMSDAQFQWLLTIFYIGYIVFQFQVLVYKLLPPRVWIAFCVFAWGLAGVCQAATTSWAGMMAARFFLAVAEAGYGTGWALYLSFFYPRTEIGVRFACFVSGGAVSAAIAGSMAYGLVHAHTALATWRLLFLIEGIPTLLMVPVAFWVLPNSLREASFLTERQKAVAEARMFRPPPPDTIDAAQAREQSWQSGLKRQINWKQASSALLDPTSYLSGVLLFIINVGYSSVPVYVPTLVAEMGFGSIRAQGLSAPPYVLAFLLSILACYLTDRWQMRGPICTFLLLVGAVGYLMLACARATAPRYVGVWLIVCGLFPFIPVLYMWLMANQASSESKRGLGLVIFATIGQCGTLLGTHLFPAREKPYYVKGTAVSAALLLLGVLVSAACSYSFWRVNRERDRADAAADVDLGNDAEKAGGMSEADRRKIHVLLHGEESTYFRYTI